MRLFDDGSTTVEMVWTERKERATITKYSYYDDMFADYRLIIGRLIVAEFELKAVLQSIL